MLSDACRACSDSRICVRASASCPSRARANIRSAASQNCETDCARYCACSGVRRATATASCCFSASSRSARIRSNGADHAVSGYGSAAVEHVPHRQRQLVQVVLNAEQLQRLAPIAIRQLGLHASQSADLAR